MKISRLIYRSDRWCQGSLAVNKFGKKLSSLNIYHTSDGKEYDPSKDCVAYSLYGAVAHLYGPDGQGDVLVKLGDAARRYVGRQIWLAEFNDAPTTKFEDIQKVLRMARL